MLCHNQYPCKLLACKQSRSIHHLSNVRIIAAHKLCYLNKVSSLSWGGEVRPLSSSKNNALNTSTKSDVKVNDKGQNIDIKARHSSLEILKNSECSSSDEICKENSEEILLKISAPVQTSLERLTKNLTEAIGKGHPLLMAAAKQIFGGKGKRIRPTIILLIGQATAELLGKSCDADLSARHMRVAEIAEIIHTASLVHDDVLDESDIRRGRRTVNSLYGTRVAVLVGDFLFAQSSWLLSCLGNIEVIGLMSQVIANFAQGEVSQATRLFDCSLSLEQYLEKSFCKTASLIASGSRAAAAVGDCSEEVKTALFQYGRHLGLAFQIVDDVLDFTETTQRLGKPRGQDLASGNLTAPTLYALWANAGKGELKSLIESRFEDPKSLERALQLVEEAGGIMAARRLAAEHAEKARTCLEVLPNYSPARHSLNLIVNYVLLRTR
uniref:Solanesyl diphosphate synthase n=1 Tax=Polytomella parva TaxID=51329 RepID=A0A7S0YGP5_9CHLO|mmetsp:Transcript_18063/g.32979  ORF Transcript_18063/g.32979 Transcript_18063/m.32979 type:complete len:439 (+) Transcript_18063:151-1467(+)|eukprot:CAMPEP_0175078952 /NCGR_PEP_ID=MMETSP0052_2-20121109/24500_1 /TAXON_ID=51329 ORGANISM="Polytomella parva, Strain SAG 63-3" /NCGR_SAMPLE_ID=MMETSP0052_2 /ASSEMBLY_ACC=CAM_ASM_000194 /LENGTH=438 /DNA_ID=CAMNT_0016349123 /DNA_START=53 /DNA_END=1369 /DNA_ORIENTATION=-